MNIEHFQAAISQLNREIFEPWTRKVFLLWSLLHQVEAMPGTIFWYD